MKEFMMIFRIEKSASIENWSAVQMLEVMMAWQSWISDIAIQGNYVVTNRLLPEGKTIKPGLVVTDGPYLDAEEILGGYLIVKAHSLEEAVEMGKHCPNLKYGGHVEIRPVMAIDHDPTSGHFLEPVN